MSQVPFLKKDISKVIILRGISGSGKSTFALEKEREGYKVISRDRIRLELLGNKEELKRYFASGLDFQLENYVTKTELKRLAQYLSKGLNIIIDNTNLKKKYLQDYIDVIASFQIPRENVTLKTLQCSLEDAIERDSKREMVVGEEVIRKQWSNFLSAGFSLDSFFDDGKWITKKKYQWYFPEFIVEKYDQEKVVGKPSCVLVDLDGTSSIRTIIPFPTPHMRDFYGYRECVTDKPNYFIKTILKSLITSDDGVDTIIFFSGRQQAARKETVDFIEQKLEISVDKFQLFMRFEDDYRADDIVKYEMFNEYIRNNYYVVGVFDDRDKVCAMWEELGVNLLNAGSLNEHF